MTRVLTEVAFTSRWSTKPDTLRVVRTPWRHRLIVWPGTPFRTLPFPYLFHRFDVEWVRHEDDYGRAHANWCGGEFTIKSANGRIREHLTVLTDA
jgi:hypothetical protein